MTDPQDWIIGEFTADDLNKKTVEYSWRTEHGKVIHGKGTLVAVARGCLMRVSILGESRTSKDGNTMVGMAFILLWNEAEKLVKNPAGSECEFSFHGDKTEKP